MRDDDRIRLRDMIEAAEAAVKFTAGKTRDDLGGDQMLAFSVIRALEVMGEAATKVSADLREELPGVPWANIVGMRNWLIHAYHDVNLDIVWRTVQEELPSLITALRSALNKG
jgi:uncharacterized protein with HEPN domain